ncbi:hypothetical protein [Helicobacter ailurogastricus]|uniref:hypothetical protein n=1 Tax=Helicobacter ailurogastricus TaxID=1578720 RepID=UPI002553C4B9|nr:hypothetical protein [Helicobacter ailurogastricus]
MEAEKIKALFLAKRDGLQEKEIENMAKKWYGAEKKAREERDFIYCVLERVEAKDIMEIIEVVGDKQYKKPVLLDDIQRITAYLKAIVPHKNEEDYLFAYFDKQYENESLWMMSGTTLKKRWPHFQVLRQRKATTLLSEKFFTILVF